MNPKVAVIVPVYNMEKYLRQCLDSLVNQTFKDIEIICFNDASTDSSLSILQEYAAKDKHIQIIDSQVNIKQGGGRNAGIRRSTAPYIMFVDADDWVEPNFVEKYYAKAEETDADIVNGNYNIINDGNIRQAVNWGLNLPNDTDFFKRKHLEANAFIWTNLYHRSLFIEKNLFFPEGIQLCEDNAVSSALYLAGKTIRKIDDYLYNYRITPNSSSHAHDSVRFKSRFKCALIAKDHNERIDVEHHYTKPIRQLFINSYYRNPIQHALGSFDYILYDEIHYANKTITDYVTKQEIKEFISNLGTSERLILSLMRQNPRFGVMAYKLINLCHRLKQRS